ncbi:RNA polymerase sigma factor [Streptomyces synnematoformans]|uniref:Sigma-70 family RNA polymerase sigma factor n=1 Tax=Streptomyces synnematoformans TaxID=415721 RepID=A0ABN2Y6B7_9ACTN
MTVPSGPSSARGALRAAFTDEWGRVVAALIRLTGDWALAEDCAQDAFAAAAKRWPRDGVPRRPGAWLTTTARNRALDGIRRSTTEARKLREAAVLLASEGPEGAEGPQGAAGGEPGEGDAEDAIPDDRLRLIFTCCHPALPMEARVALTLRTLCGLTVAEIARAFGTTEPAMAKRLVRARGKISHAGIPYRVPSAELLPERLDGVLAVLYLLFTEGYAATSGPNLVRESLSGEAIRLTRTLDRLLPGQPEVLGLLALQLLHDARRPGRVSADGRLVPLEEQDRSTWDRALIAEGAGVLAEALRTGEPPGPYVLQAQITAHHSTAPTAAATDWPAIAACYERLAALTDSPYVGLGRVVAVAMSAGPDRGLALLGDLRLPERLPGNHYVPATEADLHRRAGRQREAAEAYRAALALVTNEAERDYLRDRLAHVE